MTFKIMHPKSQKVEIDISTFLFIYPAHLCSRSHWPMNEIFNILIIAHNLLSKTCKNASWSAWIWSIDCFDSSLKCLSFRFGFILFASLDIYLCNFAGTKFVQVGQFWIQNENVTRQTWLRLSSIQNVVSHQRRIWCAQIKINISSTFLIWSLGTMP